MLTEIAHHIRHEVNDLAVAPHDSGLLSRGTDVFDNVKRPGIEIRQESHERIDHMLTNMRTVIDYEVERSEALAYGRDRFGFRLVGFDQGNALRQIGLVRQAYVGSNNSRLGKELATQNKRCSL